MAAKYTLANDGVKFSVTATNKAPVITAPADISVSTGTALCAANEDRAAEMGRRAREEWERCCSLQQTFGWIGRRLRELREARSRTPFHARREFLRELRYRGHVRKYARWKGGQTLRALGLR